MKRWNQLAPSVKLGFLVFLAACMIVVPQITPQASGYADSDEFLLISQNLSVAHPPGYGLISLLGFLFNRLVFWSTTAYAGNLLSGLFSCFTVALLSLTVAQLLHKLLPLKKVPLDLQAVIAIIPLTLLVSGVFGLYASIMEVTSLTALLLVLSVSTFGRWYLDPSSSRRVLYIAAAVFGLGVSHYQPLIIVMPIFLGFALFRLRARHAQKSLSQMAITVASFAVAFALPYVSIFIVNTTNRRKRKRSSPPSRTLSSEYPKRKAFSDCESRIDSRLNNAPRAKKLT